MNTPAKTIGELKLRFEKGGLVIEDSENADAALQLSFEQVDALVDFVCEHREEAANRRQVFRVPLWHTCGLQARMKVGNTVHETMPRNISLTGIFLAMPHDALVAPDVEVTIELEFEGEINHYEGRIARVEGDCCGVIFPETVGSDQFEPPDSLVKIVMALQRRLLRRPN